MEQNIQTFGKCTVQLVEIQQKLTNQRGLYLSQLLQLLSLGAHRTGYRFMFYLCISAQYM